MGGWTGVYLPRHTSDGCENTKSMMDRYKEDNALKMNESFAVCMLEDVDLIENHCKSPSTFYPKMVRFL
ncbi:hypothetical protein QG37_05213 [Candidozyma auris]|nr:hypothetical protein QG37_05213 [[Candida] auris]